MKSETILETFCRICLCDNATLHIFDHIKSSSTQDKTSISKKISSILNEEIEDIEGYPKYICNSCNDTIESICSFIARFKETTKILRNSLSLVKNEVFNENIDSEHSNTEIPFDDIKTEFKLENDINECEGNDGTAVACNIEKSKMTRKRRVKRSKSIKTNKTTSSILEGAYSWAGEQWCKSAITESNIRPKRAKVKGVKLKPLKSKKTKVEKLCDICGQVMKNQDKLTKHKKFVHFRKSYKCPHEKCTKVCTSELYLNRHIKRKHNDKRDFVCNVCGNCFAFKNELNKHIRLHDREKYPRKQFTCQYCDKTYKSQKSVVIHERSFHTGDRPAVCSECNSSFFHEDYLKEHMRLHTGETPFKCPVCNRGYAQRGNMKSHLRSHRLTELDSATLRKIKPNFLKLLKV